MPDEFQYDVFLSHSAKDKAVVHSGEELRRWSVVVGEVKFGEDVSVEF
ncbi:MAG: hypothetical protein ABSD29_22350 [Verrucomicrobiota bacterium]